MSDHAGARGHPQCSGAFQGSTVPLAALVQPLAAEDSRDWLCAAVANGLLTGVEGHPREGQMRLCGVYALHRQALRCGTRCGREDGR
jgi:hypothetical protein